MPRYTLLFLVALLSPLVHMSAEQVPIYFNVPAGGKTYTGRQPVTFGVPFERGVLDKTHGIRIVDARGNPVPAQFEVTATWGPESSHVRWLLIDLLADIRDGKAEPVFLEFGKDVKPVAQETGLRIERLDRDVLVHTGAVRFRVGPVSGMLGSFVLLTGDGREFKASVPPCPGEHCSRKTGERSLFRISIMVSRFSGGL